MNPANIIWYYYLIKYYTGTDFHVEYRYTYMYTVLGFEYLDYLYLGTHALHTCITCTCINSAYCAHCQIH